MQILLDKLMPALIANYISKLPCFEDKCGAEINDLAKLIHKYMSNDDLLIKALLAKQIDHDTISLIVSDLHLLINCLNNSEDLTLTNQNNFAVIKTADNNQKTPIKRLSVDKIKNLKIEICFNEMTFSEKEMLRTQNFDNLWKYLWINHNSRCFLNEYDNAKKKFDSLPIKELLKQSKNTYDFTELGYPKGRRNITEHNITCAEREFQEETGYTKQCYEYIKNYPIIKEEFTGTNGVEYQHIYYLVKMKDTAPIPHVNKMDKIQTGEVRNIGWFTLNESISLLRDYDIAKKEMIIKVHSDLVQMKNYECSPIFYNTYIKEEDKANIYNNIKNNYINSDNVLI